MAHDRSGARLCYVDGFAGPWNARSESLDDTSIAISLKALETAAAAWRDRGATIEVEATFVEKEPGPFEELQQYLASRSGTIKTLAHKGEFGTFVPELKRWLAGDAGLIFVDPTGWKGAAMRFIAPLIAGPSRRDVLVNVMFDHINRFKDDERNFLRRQMSEFFGLGDEQLPEGLEEEELFALYRKKLKELCGVPFAGDLAIPHPTMARTKFRLVVGGKSPAVLELFRDVESKVVGREAAVVRDDAATRQEFERTGQMSLVSSAPPTDRHYESLHSVAVRQAPVDLVASLRWTGPTRFCDIWPALLEEHHLKKSELAALAWSLKKQGTIVIENTSPRERTVKDEHVLRLADTGSR